MEEEGRLSEPEFIEELKIVAQKYMYLLESLQNMKRKDKYDKNLPNDLRKLSTDWIANKKKTIIEEFHQEVVALSQRSKTVLCLGDNPSMGEILHYVNRVFANKNSDQ
jgi:hypothetical protein